jgi:hypothetical protein
MTKRYATRWTVIATMAVLVPLASLGAASPAMAQPKGIFSIFSNCPLATFKALGIPPEKALCTFNVTSGGELAIGSTKVPINSGVNAGKTITLEGGAIPTGNPENEREYFALAGANGQSFSKTELNVPGGLLDIVNCENITGDGIWEIIERGTCKAIFENPNSTGVTAVTESVANATNPPILNLKALGLQENTAAVTLPVRVHLKNPLLGNSCYIGSEAKPIQLHLTTGTTSPKSPNKPISGKRGTPETLEETIAGQELEMLRLSENSLVDNAFSVPTAEGCGEFFSFIIDPIVDSKLKLPSEDGSNTAILNGTLNTSTSEEVERSEK